MKLIIETKNNDFNFFFLVFKNMKLVMYIKLNVFGESFFISIENNNTFTFLLFIASKNVLVSFTPNGHLISTIKSSLTRPSINYKKTKLVILI